ncbi:DEAD/DEAH box helicase [Rhizobiales bacterium]|uniref:DEAD/DEAH box helicase n=1 Tax=Hongsoonwoonella zoysiae TaxID=2821844 RepID=UPI00156126C3|nr:DEAD/DEAH box helicase [Hongsoonwoonella zoysiae]NRG16697.1 DEAD/DEAH box helicase [Hongsoonwoonella zoysiae]
MTDFHSLGLARPILLALDSAEYSTPTPIQAQAIPLVLEGRDLLGIAQTGTGKTAAFSLPMIDRLLATNIRPSPRGTRGLVLAPTRELADQIATNIRKYAAKARMNVNVVIGGVPIGRQIRMMSRGLDILVATPGRLIDLYDRRALHFDDLEFFVLDEADQMMDLGFIHALKRIASLLPKDRQSLFFSATMPKEIADLAASFLTDPAQVAVTPAATTVERVSQAVAHVPAGRKPAVLGDILSTDEVTRAIVFTRTKRGADRVSRTLEEKGIAAVAIHGNKSQGQRQKALAGFSSGRLKVLVATDIAARGIDIGGVSHVVNYEMPDVPETYVHRIGRTARAGASGQAISLVSADERGQLRAIERLTKQALDVMSGFEPQPGEEVEPRRGNGGRGRGQSRPNGGNARDGKPQGNRSRGGEARGKRFSADNESGFGGRSRKSSEVGRPNRRPRQAEGERAGR